ncbi:uncharacterized protein LOC143244866 isoform X2 [Tachypleus tridentatus]
MKLVTAVILLTAVVYVNTHGPHNKMEEMLCDSGDQEVEKALKNCWTFEPAEYKTIFKECRANLDAETDAKLCAKWDEVFDCSHIGYNHKESDYQKVTDCINEEYAAWKQ